MDKRQIDSQIGHFGLVSVLYDYVKTIPDNEVRELFEAFISETTSCLSDEDLDALAGQVAEQLMTTGSPVEGEGEGDEDNEEDENNEDEADL